MVTIVAAVSSFFLSYYGPAVAITVVAVAVVATTVVALIAVAVVVAVAVHPIVAAVADNFALNEKGCYGSNSLFGMFN